MELYDEQQPYDDESETDAEYSSESDDSQDDPTFDVLEKETRLTFSKLSVKKKTKTRIVRGSDEKDEEMSDVLEMVMPVLDEQDQKSYEVIQKIIEVGKVDSLKVDQCKVYLRKHGLRLSGKKETLLQRIKEHINIVNGDGEKKYPASSFVLDCKGDACMGDIVMFEQNVYEVFNIASHSASGPPCGTRVVVGRIVKESYGAAKQQHTFTIEVLWNKGEKPLSPLHPLLIKGRNLYRLKTLRQKWEDEGERQRILSEKHARGGVARLNRKARRIEQREMRKTHKATRVTRNEQTNGKKEDGKQVPPHNASIVQPKQQNPEQKAYGYTTMCKENITIQAESFPNTSNVHPLSETNHQRQPLISMNHRFQKGQQDTRSPKWSKFDSSKSPTRNYFSNSNHPLNPLRGYNVMENQVMRSPVRGILGVPSMNANCQSYVHQSHAYHKQDLNGALNSPVQQRGRGGQKWACRYYPPGRWCYPGDIYHTHASHRQNFHGPLNPPAQQKDFGGPKQTCRYHVQGRCHFGDRCKYLHEPDANKL